MDSIKNRITELTKIINYHRDIYYNKNNNEISDQEYDTLFNELKSLETKYPELVSQDSPTQKVGGEVLNIFSKVEHKVQMGSLQDVFSFEDVESFCNKCKNLNSNTSFVVEPKIDGLSVSLEYENGIFIRGSTRGDGFVGEDVTNNLKTIKNIPKQLKDKIPYLEVRGEVYMPRKVFYKLVESQMENEEQPFKNPRNAAAGSLRQKKSAIVAKRKLDIFIFNIQQIEGVTLTSHKNSLDFLSEQGFNVVPEYLKIDEPDKVVKAIDDIGNNRSKYEFDIDGAVVKVDDFNQRSLLGNTVKTPKWAVAYKFPAEEKNTKLIDIITNVGRTGAITPVAIFEPVLLAGTSVSKASLHNQDFINEKNVAIGDIITVRKAGDIIPEVVSVAEKNNNEIYSLPKVCPICGTLTVKELEESAIRCPNVDCPAQIERSIAHFASKSAMDIDGLGPMIVKTLIKNKLIESVADLYSLTVDELLELDRFKEKSVNNLINAIEKSKDNSLDKLIFGLGIRHIGAVSAKDLCEKFNNIDNIINAKVDNILEIDGFGEIMAESVVQAFHEPHFIEIIEKLKSCGVNTSYTKESVDDRFNNQTFVLTGTLPTMTRNEAKELIEKYGGKTSSSVSKKTNFVLAGEEAGSKLTKAQNLGVNIIDENKFKEMLL